MPTSTEAINEALLQDVLAIYSDAEDKMLKAVAKRIAKGIKTEGWNETKLKDTQLLKKEIEAILNDTSKKSNTKHFGRYPFYRKRKNDNRKRSVH